MYVYTYIYIYTHICIYSQLATPLSDFRAVVYSIWYVLSSI